MKYTYKRETFLVDKTNKAKVILGSICAAIAIFCLVSGQLIGFMSSCRGSF